MHTNHSVSMPKERDFGLQLKLPQVFGVMLHFANRGYTTAVSEALLYNDTESATLALNVATVAGPTSITLKPLGIPSSSATSIVCGFMSEASGSGGGIGRDAAHLTFYAPKQCFSAFTIVSASTLRSRHGMLFVDRRGTRLIRR